MAAHERASVTRRTACWSARTVSRPTSPPTSGTCFSKLERGFQLQLVPVGADHHGYVARIKAAFQALGGAPDAIELPLQQFVHLIEGSERAKMSKRRGDFITLDQLIDEIGVDASRYFMLQRSHDRTVDLDLDLARRESAENPVYYIQYAHARIVDDARQAAAERVAAALGPAPDWGTGELERRRAGSDQGADRVPRRGRRGGRRGAGRTGSPPTRWSWPRSSPPSTATAR